MNESARSLDVIQRWMLSVTTHPGGVADGIDSEESRRYVNIRPKEVEQVIRRSCRLTSIERLQVYANAYYTRLMECFEEEFPALRHALGEEAFGGFAVAYLQSYPPHSYTLGQLGSNFPRFLQETRPSIEDDDYGDSKWPDFLIDLATLERTYSEVFDSPGPENGRILQPDDLVAVPPERWPELRLSPVECLRLLELNFPVHEYASAVRRGEHPPIPQPDRTCLVVFRRAYVVRRQAASQMAFGLLRNLCDGQSVGEAVTSAAQEQDIGVDQLATTLRNWFEEWAAAGFFRFVEL